MGSSKSIYLDILTKAKHIMVVERCWNVPKIEFKEIARLSIGSVITKLTTKYVVRCAGIEIDDLESDSEVPVNTFFCEWRALLTFAPRLAPDGTEEGIVIIEISEEVTKTGKSPDLGELSN